MADLYGSRTYYHHHQQPQHHHHSQYTAPAPLQHPTANNAPQPHSDDSDDTHPKQQSPAPKPEAKPQATFLTKLYALLERPENHHMIRWDPAGEHIIVERPEQLALHVLPSIYRQSRFASFSRQLNIYGFMRKVNLRNVDPAIDDPDASTWSHPTLNRHSPPEVVANFKRRVPPRLPKPRKSQTTEPNIPPPRSAVAMTPGVPLAVPGGNTGKLAPVAGRARGFSAPSPYVSGGGNNAPPPPPASNGTWSGNYSRNPIPPLTVPSNPSNPSHLSHNSMYGHSSHSLQPISPAEESPSYPHHPHHMSSYGGEGGYSYSGSNGSETTQWNSYSANGASAGQNSSGSLSSLLNPSGHSNGNGTPAGGYNARPSPTVNTSYGSQFSHLPVEHSASSLSPDSRPPTGYSMHSLGYGDEQGHLQNDYDSRPGSSHHRGHSPTGARPHSSASRSPYPPPASLRTGRPRRHSQAINPYPSPYEHNDRHSSPVHEDQQHPPSSSHGYSQAADQSNSGSQLSRSRSMIQLPSVDPYGMGNGGSQPQAEFAFNAGMDAMGPSATQQQQQPHQESARGGSSHGWGGGGPSASGARPSTGASTISAASSGSQANTPPLQHEGVVDTKINRFSQDFGYAPNAIVDHIPTSATPFQKLGAGDY